MSSGDYYLAKTIKYFKSHGWQVERTEYKYKIPGTKFWRKRDVFGADFIAMSDRIVFVNVTTQTNVSKHVKRFEGYSWPNGVEWLVIYWKKGAKLPTIRQSGRRNE